MRRHRPDRRPDLDPAPAGSPPRGCAWPGCEQVGEFRAPLSRDSLREYQWLCLDHVREFNRSWDYFKDMSPHEIDRHRREDVVWHRPTWRTSVKGFGPCIHDPLGILGDRLDLDPGPREGFTHRVEPKTERMLKRLGLAGNADLAEVKKRYRSLAKRHHPDLLGGDRAAEERLKLINEAYTYLLHCGELA